MVNIKRNGDWVVGIFDESTDEEDIKKFIDVTHHFGVNILLNYIINKKFELRKAIVSVNVKTGELAYYVKAYKYQYWVVKESSTATQDKTRYAIRVGDYFYVSLDNVRSFAKVFPHEFGIFIRPMQRVGSGNNFIYILDPDVSYLPLAMKISRIANKFLGGRAIVILHRDVVKVFNANDFESSSHSFIYPRFQVDLKYGGICVMSSTFVEIRMLIAIAQIVNANVIRIGTGIYHDALKLEKDYLLDTIKII